MSETVFIVNHVHELSSGEEDVKFIGVYRTEQEAQAAVDRAKVLPGFAECPEGFDVQGYELGKDHWTEGYFTYLPEDDK